MQFTLPITSSASAEKGNLYRWVNPAPSVSTSGISGWAATAANTYVGVIGQPSNPRCLRFSATPSWNGGSVTVNGTFDGSPVPYPIEIFPEVPTVVFVIEVTVVNNAVGMSTFDDPGDDGIVYDTGDPSNVPFTVTLPPFQDGVAENLKHLGFDGCPITPT
jgi:hypothetical protein